MDHNQTIDGKVAANSESLTNIVYSSAAMIPPAGAETQNEEDNIWKWISETPWEEFDTEDLNFLTLQSPPEISNNACQLPLEFGHYNNLKLSREQNLNPNEGKFSTLTPELQSLILWQSENVGFKGEAAVGMRDKGKARLDDDTTISNQQVAAENNRKRKGIEVDDNYENNARVSVYFSGHILVIMCQLHLYTYKGLAGLYKVT